MIDKETMIELLKQWGYWQRTAKRPNLCYVVSQYDSPLQKKRDVKPIYKDSIAEHIDQLIVRYLPKDYKLILEMTYVDQTLNPIAADILKCSVKSYTNKRNEAISMLQGVYSVKQEVI